ncbi:MAG: class 1 fructose-bisphosphatase [Candidatus Acidoferrum typicum]|nr:class 1 fructose-bisphosphatase [Candidatus Acidoferrum typicum]
MTDRIIVARSKLAADFARVATTRRVEARASSGEESPSTLERGLSLDAFLAQSASGNNDKQALAVLLRLIATASIQVADLIALGHLAGTMGAPVGTPDFDGDVQRRLDIMANETFVNAVRSAPVAAVLCEELSDPLLLDPEAPLVVAIDPLDGSSNIDANVSIGTIFAVFPAVKNALRPADHFLRPGHEQVGAGFIIYGPHTSFVFTLGDGVHVFTLDRRAGVFKLAIPSLAVPADCTEYAVNASNYRHWDESVRAFIDDCIKGADGPLCRDHSMRWIASLVADAYRILVRGGVFLYPGDQRHGYRDGRLRLTYEANPISFLVEQAGGSATNAVQRILDIKPKELHTRTPIVFGSRAAVQRISRYHTDPQFSAEHAPLFFYRGLIRR